VTVVSAGLAYSNQII